MELNIYAPQIQHCVTGRKSLKGLLLESEFKEISFTSRQCNCLYFLFFVTYLFSTTQSPQASPPPLSSGFRTALDIPLQLLSNLYNIPVLHPRHCHSSIWGCFGGFMGFPWIESTCSLSPNAKQCNWKSAPRTAPFETDNLRILVKPTSDELTENPASQLALELTGHRQALILLQDLTVNGQKVWVEAKKTPTKNLLTDVVRCQASQQHPQETSIHSFLHLSISKS